ncbi:Ubiquinol cytochrome-c reductase assembly protein Cbp3 [Coemansia sp. Benny D115]|nr:Ubiquinol cytochrome-c reductase assembly protein Cbp3 [Coemansia sp. Benny D115]
MNSALNRSTLYLRAVGKLALQTRSQLRLRVGQASLNTSGALLYTPTGPHYSTKPETPSATPPSRTPVLSPKYASFVRKIFKWILPQYQSQIIGKNIYDSCSKYPDYKEFWIAECELPDTFQTWFSTSSLYLWMAMVRVRADPNAKYYNQALVDEFFHDTEKKIRASGIKSGRIVNDTLKDLVSSFKGTVMSLDEGFARSDAALAAAIWRNIVPVDDAVLQVDKATRYVRSQLQMLDRTDMSQITAGDFAFEHVDAQPQDSASGDAAKADKR